jgi:hypothetical protein
LGALLVVLVGAACGASPAQGRTAPDAERLHRVCRRLRVVSILAVDGAHDRDRSRQRSPHRPAPRLHQQAGGQPPFPVGTIVVKESGDGDLTTRHVFAMVKRGGDFNATGMVNWELFELQNGADGSVSMMWRGVGPTNGDAYGGDATVGCNTCHLSAAPQDFIFTTDLAPLLAP